MLSKIILLVILFTCCVLVQAKVTLPRIFSDNLVLQRETAIPVWGWANPGETVTVRFNKQYSSAIADANGKWSLALRSERAGGPFTMTVRGEEAIAIKNVMVGEVWLCAGQSNMEWTVGQSMNAHQELATADIPGIRQIKISKTVNSVPQQDFDLGAWQVSNHGNTRDFTGVGYFFARDLYRKLKVPIGLINVSWGGTNIETWISREGFESADDFREMISRVPRVGLSELRRIRVGRKLKQIEDLQGIEIGDFNRDEFMKMELDHSRLQSLNLPGLWESQNLGDFDGVVWLRKVVFLSTEQSRNPASIELAKIDDDDVTYVNGFEVGRTNQWDARRNYRIPAGILREGDNLVVVKVTDTGGGGGIYGNATDLKLVLGEENISLAGPWKFQVESITSGISVNSYPSLAYNAMIDPIIRYGFRGAIWYQGESNVGRAYQYRKAFPLLIDDWRKKSHRPRFPFYFVQLATFKTAGNSNEGSEWAELREAQAMTLTVPNTGMVVTTDVGNPLDIHPTNKQEVGRRLASLALNRTYNNRMIDSGPTFRKMRIVSNTIVLTFDNIGRGLMTTERNGLVKGFEIAGSDQKFYEAKATIDGKAIVVSCDQVASPVAVRFGWVGDCTACTLFNREGFPAVPFRTDNWNLITKAVKYSIAGIR